jgi:hypothetical protein
MPERQSPEGSLGSAWQRSFVKFCEHFEGFSEHGIFHGIII